MTTTLQAPDSMTVWSDPEEIMISGYGRISYREWCELEMARHNRDKAGSVRMDTRESDGWIALSR